MAKYKRAGSYEPKRRAKSSRKIKPSSELWGQHKLRILLSFSKNTTKLSFPSIKLKKNYGRPIKAKGRVGKESPWIKHRPRSNPY